MHDTFMELSFIKRIMGQVPDIARDLLDADCLPPPKRRRRGEQDEPAGDGDDDENNADESDDDDESEEADAEPERPVRGRAKAKAKAKANPAGKAKAKAKAKAVAKARVRQDNELLKRKSKAYHRARAASLAAGQDQEAARAAGRKVGAHDSCVRGTFHGCCKHACRHMLRPTRLAASAKAYKLNIWLLAKACMIMTHPFMHGVFDRRMDDVKALA